MIYLKESLHFFIGHPPELLPVLGLLAVVSTIVSGVLFARFHTVEYVQTILIFLVTS